MITDFRKWVTALGNNDTNEYSFPFRITSAAQIVVVQLDVSGDPTTIDWIERGNVGLNIQSVDFDSVLGGGTITFADNLPAGKRIYIKVANDAPTQPTRFRDDQDFKLRSIENALDFIVDQVTRLYDKTQRSIRFADHFSHVESTVNLEMQEFPMAYGMPIMDTEALQLEMKPFLQILEEQGILQRLINAEDGATQAAADAAAAALSAANAEIAAEAAEVSAAEAAASAAAAIGASVSNRIQFPLYAPMENGALVEEEYEQEVCKLDINNRVTAFAKMSQYFIPGRPIVLGFCSYSPTFDVTSKYKLQVTVTLVKNGQEVSTVVNQVIINNETTVTAVASALKVHNLTLSADGTINAVAVDPNDGLKLEIKRIDASANEDVSLTRILKQTAELSFA